MNFADLGTSKRLHELLKDFGVVPESEFSYKYHKVNGTINLMHKSLATCCVIICPAYSFDEVWGMLPKKLYFNVTGGEHKWKRGFWKRQLSETAVSYTLYYEVTGQSCGSETRHFDYPESTYPDAKDNMTQAAHKLLIETIETHSEEVKKHLTMEE